MYIRYTLIFFDFYSIIRLNIETRIQAKDFTNIADFTNERRAYACTNQRKRTTDININSSLATNPLNRVRAWVLPLPLPVFLF